MVDCAGLKLSAACSDFELAATLATSNPLSATGMADCCVTEVGPESRTGRAEQSLAPSAEAVDWIDLSQHD